MIVMRLGVLIIWNLSVTIFVIAEIMEHRSCTTETATYESIHYVYGWKFNLNFPNHDSWNDDFQTY